MTSRAESGHETLHDLFVHAASRYSQATALMYKNDRNEFVGLLYGELSRSVDLTAMALRGMGVTKGDRVAIFSYNRPEWIIADLAILKLGAVVVPIYHTLPPPAVAHVLSDSGSKLVFVQNSELLKGLEGIRGTLPSLAAVVVFEARGVEGGKGILRFDQLERGEVAAGETSGDLPVVSPDDPATIVYTSGTTGKPKGVVLSHRNIVFNALSLIRRFTVTPDDVFLSFLPLCHMLEKTCGCYTMLFAGATIAYVRDMSTIVQDVQRIHPTVMISVPRVIEKVYEAVEQRVIESSRLRQKLVYGSIRHLNRYTNLKYRGQSIMLSLKITHFLADALVASKFRKITGGRLRLLVSGGAPLDRKLSKTLLILGFNILEGYGLTETSPVVCSTTLEENRLGTVGKPLEGVEVKTGANDEILVRGPNVMQGYFNRPEETARVFDEEGWFHTGDQGRFDERGNLVITGRIKGPDRDLIREKGRSSANRA